LEKIRTALIIVVLIGIGICAYFVLAPLLERKAVVPASLSQPSSQTPDQGSVRPTDTQDTAALDWVIYENTPLGFSITHPADLPPQEQAETIVFSKWGPSQQRGTEFYDGISLIFENGQYEGSFLSLVQGELAKTKEWPTYESSTDLEAVAVAGREAWSFKVVSMLESTYIYIKKNDHEFFRISNNTQDPTDQGFEQIVDRMLDSLQLN